MDQDVLLVLVLPVFAEAVVGGMMLLMGLDASSHFSGLYYNCSKQSPLTGLAVEFASAKRYKLSEPREK